MTFYDVNAAIDKPNIVNSLRQGFMFGQQKREIEQQEADRNELRALAPKVVAGDPNAFARATAIDPNYAQAQDNAGTSQLRKLKGFVEYVDRQRATGNPMAVNAALREGAGFLAPMLNGRPPPTEWTPDMDAGWEQLKAKVAMLPADDGATPAQIQVFEAQARAAGLQPGTPEYQKAAQIALGLQGRASSAGMGFDMVEDANGVPRPQRRDPRTGTVEMFIAEQGAWIPLGGGQMAPPASAPPPSSNGDPKADSIVQAANAMVTAGIPPQEIEVWMQRTLNTAGMQPTSSGQMPPQAAPAPVQGDISRTPINEYGGGAIDPTLGRGRTKEQEAAAVREAEIRTDLQFAPEKATLEADAARQKKEAEALAERNATTEKRGTQAAETVAVLNDAIKILPEATGGIAGQTRDAAGRTVNQSTEGSRATARLKLLAAKLIANVPRFEGPQSNIDVQFYREAAGDLANANLSVGERQAAAELMLEIAQRYANAPADTQGGAAAPVEGARKAPDGNWYVQQQGQWFKVEL